MLTKNCLQVRLCREKKSGNIFAMKKLKKSEMLSRGQVRLAVSSNFLMFLMWTIFVLNFS